MTDAEISAIAERSRLLRQLDARDEVRRRRKKPPSCGGAVVVPARPRPHQPNAAPKQPVESQEDRDSACTKVEAVDLPPHVLKAFLLLDPGGAWTAVDRPYSGWLSTIPSLVEGHNFQLSSVPVTRRARLTVEGITFRLAMGMAAEQVDPQAKTSAG